VKKKKKVAFHIALPVAAVALALRTPLTLYTFLFSVVYYLWCGFSYTAGYHRLFAHKAYKCSAPLELLFTWFGAANFLGPIVAWCRDHRAHHRNADTPRVCLFSVAINWVPG